jgi:hypothetical protein
MRSRSLLDVLDDEERRDKECGIAEARNHGIAAPLHRCGKPHMAARACHLQRNQRRRKTGLAP